MQPPRGPYHRHSFAWGTTAVAIMTLVAACSSEDSGGSKPTSTGGTAGAAGKSQVTFPAEGPYGTCNPTEATDVVPDLNGRWALQTDVSRYVPKTGLTAPFYTRTVSLLLVNQSQTGTNVTLDATYCDQYAEDPEALAHVVIPKLYVQSIQPFIRQGTYARGSLNRDLLAFPTFTEVEGAKLANPSSDPLPTDASDPSLFDQDGDGHPGVTIKLSGITSGDLYVVQRQSSELTGVAVTAERIEGRYDFTTEQIVIDSNPSVLTSLASQTAVADPRTCSSRFTLVRVAATATCADLLADATLFP